MEYVDELALCKQVAEALGLEVRQFGLSYALFDGEGRIKAAGHYTLEVSAYRSLLTWNGAGVIVEEMKERGWQFRLSSGESQQEYYAEFWQPAGKYAWSSGTTDNRAPLAVLEAAKAALAGLHLADGTPVPYRRISVPEIPEGYNLPTPDTMAGGGRPC